MSTHESTPRVSPSRSLGSIAQDGFHTLLTQGRRAAHRLAATASQVDRELHQNLFASHQGSSALTGAVLSTGFPALDHALGCQGYPLGCVVEWIADSSSGFRLLGGLLDSLARQGQYAALTNGAEQIGSQVLQQEGVDPSRVLMLSHPGRAGLVKLCQSTLSIAPVGAMVLDPSLLSGGYHAPALRDQEELWTLSLTARRSSKLLVLWHDPNGPMGETPLGACHVQLRAESREDGRVMLRVQRNTRAVKVRETTLILPPRPAR